MSDHNEVDFEEIEEELEESELICERQGEYKQMGMYAEINVCFDLTKGTPKNVVDVLYYPMRRKTPCFSYGDIRRVHRIYASN